MAGNTPVPDVVDAPTIGTATAGVESATVTFTAATTGGAATTFGAISTPGSVTGSSATSPITVSGLTAGTAYTFKTYGINSSGTWSNVLSAASNSVTPTAATAFESIATVTLTSATSTISFTSIPATYTHLQVRGIARTDRSDSNQDALKIRYNSDTGNNYAIHYLLGNQISASAGGATGISGVFADGITNTNSAANCFGAFVIDILDYTNTNKYKVNRALSGREDATAGALWFESGLWVNTNAISSITIIPNTGPNFVQYSQFALYGIKGA